MREQKIHSFWVVKGKILNQEQKAKYFEENNGRQPTEEELKECPNESTYYEGMIYLLSIELDSFFSAISDGTSDIIHWEYKGYTFEEVFTKEDVNEIVEEETEKLRNRIDNINGFLDNITSHLDDLKSSMSDLDYYCDEAIEDCTYAQNECEDWD